MNISRVCFFVIANASFTAGLSVMARAALISRVSSRRQRRAEVHYVQLEKTKKCDYAKKQFSTGSYECATPPINNLYDIHTYKMLLWEFHQSECSPKELNIVENILAFLAACLIFTFILLPMFMD